MVQIAATHSKGQRFHAVICNLPFQAEIFVYFLKILDLVPFLCVLSFLSTYHKISTHTSMCGLNWISLRTFVALILVEHTCSQRWPQSVILGLDWNGTSRCSFLQGEQRTVSREVDLQIQPMSSPQGSTYSALRRAGQRLLWLKTK